MQAKNTRWTKLLVATALALSTSYIYPSLAATSTTTLTQANQTRAISEAEQFASQGQYTEAATRFEALAAQSTGTNRDHFALKAARNAQLAGDDAKAQGLLALAGKNLSAEDNTLRALTNASLLLKNNQADLAIAQLDQIPLPLPMNLAAEVLSVRVQALFAAGRPVLAVSTAVERERNLNTDAELAQNRQLIWNNLKQAASTGRDLTPPAGANRITAGWLELAKLFNTSQRDPFAFNRGLSDWRTRYPAHPGASMLTPSAPTIPPSATGEQRIALLLPLTGKQQAAGIAIRDGFIAATLQTSSERRPIVEVFDTNEAGATQAYQRAMQGGSNMVVGPLLKEEVDALASTQVGVMTLALNAISEGKQPPALMFQFSLDPEEEARQVAQRARSEGRTRAILLTPNNDWGKRIQNAFIAELKAEGGTLVDQRSYDPASRDYVGISKQLFASKKPAQARALDDAVGKRTTIESRDDFDYIFIAAQAAQAKQLRPALRFVLPDASVPIYATSDAYEPETSNNADLEGLRFVDMPWVINRGTDIDALHEDMTRLWTSNLRARSRLYAFGIDAFKLANWLKSPQPQLSSPLSGATGLLALDQAGRVRRQAEWAQIVNGKPQPLPISTN